MNGYTLLLITIICQVTQVQFGWTNFTSPCPELLVEKSFEVGIWGGTLHIRLDPDNIGLFIKIIFDNKINIITNNHVTMTTTSDNRVFLLEDFYFKPPPAKPSQPSPRFALDFKCHFNGALATPQIEKIYINGRLECPPRLPEHTTIPFINIFDDDDED